MLKLARWSTTHRKYVVLGWLVLLLAVNTFAQSAGTTYSNNFTLPNSDAQRASDLLARSFPAQAGDRDTIVSPRHHAMRLAAAVSGAILEVLPGSGHLLHHAAADRIVAAVEQLVGRV